MGLLTIKKTYPCFRPSELFGNAEVTPYRGVLIVWDHDHDDRIIRFVDGLTDDEREGLVACGESKACLDLWWGTTPPTRFAEGVNLTACDGDTWVVNASKYLGDPD